MQKRSAERIDPSTLQQSDEETEELAVKVRHQSHVSHVLSSYYFVLLQSRSYNFRSSSSDTRASKRAEKQQSRDELAFAQPTGSEQVRLSRFHPGHKISNGIL